MSKMEPVMLHHFTKLVKCFPV